MEIDSVRLRCVYFYVINKKKALQNPMVKAEYDALQSEYDEK